MNGNRVTHRIKMAAFWLPAVIVGPMLATAATTIYTVPFQASAPAVPHTSWKNNPVTLKGAVQSPVGGDTYIYYWDPGDGTSGCGTAGSPLTAADPYSIGCAHTYNSSSTAGAAVGIVYTANLYVKDSTAGDSSYTSAPYYTKIYALDPTNSQSAGNVYNLPIEVNNAIDNGLWYAHTHMHRYADGSGNLLGDWTTNGLSGNMYSSYHGLDGLDCNSLEVSGFLPSNSPANPYTDDVKRCLNSVIGSLTAMSISSSAVNYSGTGNFNPDQNSNGQAVYIGTSSEQIYQTGMAMDALVSSGQPSALIPHSLNTSLPTTGTGAGGLYSYKDVVFDLVDFYAYCQANSGYNAGGAWIYNCGDNGGDNSSSQWGAIGIIPAVRKFGAVFNSASKLNNAIWLTSTQASDGSDGYRGTGCAWGCFATTPSALVQMALDGVGTGSTLGGTSTTTGTHTIANAWDKSASYMRDNFNSTSTNPTVNPKEYLYGLFSFTKGMLLHDNTGGAAPTPVSTLHTINHTATESGGAYADIDWYAAQTAAYGGSDPTVGVARQLILDQNSDGSWYGHTYTSEQYPMTTGISITMLNKTVFQAVPVACASASPASISNGGTVTFDGSCSYDQNAPTTNLTSWQWNTSDDNSGNSPSTTFNVQSGNAKCQTASCVKMSQTITTAHSLPYTFPIRLRVTNNASPALTADVLTSVTITTAAKAPTSVIGGPYNFCPSPYTPWSVSGANSIDPDPAPSLITSYAWDFNGANTFTDASGAVVDVTSAFTTKVGTVPAGGTTFSISLQVTNNETPALSNISSNTATVHSSSDNQCSHCVTTTQALPKAPTASNGPEVQLYWVDTNSTGFPIDHYNVYRSTNAAFNANVVKVAGPGSGVAPIPAPATKGAQVNFADLGVVVNQLYYYRIAPATVNDTETCASAVSVSAIVHPSR